MSTRNVILGACATCLAVGSALASHLAYTPFQAWVNGSQKTIYIQSGFSCSTGTKCVVQVKTVNGNVVVTADATLLTTTGHVIPGSGLVAADARTKDPS